MKKHIYYICFGAVLYTAATGCIQTKTTGTSTNDTLVSAGNKPGNNKAKDTNLLLIPGVRAGQVSLNENSENIIRRMGRPDGGDAAMGKAVEVWYDNHDSTAYSTAIYTSRDIGNDETARVKQIRITSPSFTTAEGIHTGSSLSDIKNRFTVEKTETYQDEGISYTVYDSDKGIAFEIDSEAKKCAAIIIHKAGTTDPGTYLKFRTTNKFYKSGR